MLRIALMLTGCLVASTWCASVLGQAPATVSIGMLVEHDAWTAKCETDPKLPGISRFGWGYGRLAADFVPGNAYRITGRLGWSFLLTVSAEGQPSVSEVQAGPHLVKAPTIRVVTDDPELKNNPVEVRFGPVPEFRFVVPVDYLGWEIVDAYEMRVGSRQVELPDGTWEMRGALGWSIPLEVTGGQIRLAGDPVGIEAAAVRLSAEGLTLAPPARPNRVAIHVPTLLGSYSVQTTKNRVLIPSGIGPQTAALPPGNYKLQGKDWTADLTVTEGRATANLPEATRAGLLVVNNQQILPCRAGTLSLPVPWGSVSLTVPDKDTGATSLGLWWSRNNQVALLATLTDTAGGWRVAAKFLRGRGADWPLTMRFTPLDAASPVPAQDFGALPPEGKDIRPPEGLPSGAYMIAVEAQPPGGAPDAGCQASLVLPVTGTPAASLWFAVNRAGYWVDEPVEFVAWQQAAESRFRCLSLVLVGPAGKTLPLGTFTKGTACYTIPPNTLATGQYFLELRDGPAVLARRVLRILPQDLRTNFYIDAYGRVTGRYDAVEKLNELGIQTFSEQAGTNVLTEPRTPPLAASLAALADVPGVGPASRYVTQGDRFLDKLDELGWRFFAQWSCAHQPYGYGMTYTDPIVVNRVKMTSLWAAQYGRQHPCFLGINMFDEGGTPRGPRMSDDASYLEYQAFEAKFGRPKPRFLGEDDEAARAWIYDKQEQHNFIYSATGDRLKEINVLADPGAHLYLGTQNGNLNSMAVDGGHPPLAYRAITLSPMHWYAGYINTCFILLGNEYNFMQPKPIEFFPLIWGDGHHFLTRHEVNLAVSRQADGVGYFEWPGVLNNAQFNRGQVDPEAPAREAALKTLNERLAVYGDLFRTVRRDRRSEVAVLHSLYDFAPRLFPTPEEGRVAYNNAFKAAYTGYLAISGCLRLGIQAGWLCEEEILQRDGLAGRKVLILPGITAMMPELQAKLAAFIAAGGTVFADAATTVEIPGARRLEVDFGRLVDEAIYKQVDEEGKESQVRVDRVVLPRLLSALRPVEEVVGTHLTPGTPELLVTRQVNGQAEYYYCLNDRIPPLEQLPAPLSEYRVQKYHLPLTTEVTLPGQGVVYDVFAGKEIGRATESVRVPVELEEGGMALFAVLPEAVSRLALSAPEAVKPGRPATLRVQVMGESGRPLSAAVPLELRFLSPAGREARPALYRSTDAGVFATPLQFGLFDPPQVRVVVRDLLSGKEAEAQVRVEQSPSASLLIERREPVVVENGRAVARFLASQKHVILALGDGPEGPTEVQVQPLVAALNSRGVAVEVRRASEVSRKSHDVYVGRGLARMHAPVYTRTSSFEVDGPVIAVGNSSNNALIRWVVQDHNFTRYGDWGFPGPGRGYVVHVWQPFSLEDDAVLVIAEDAEGLGKAVAWMKEACARAR